MNRSLPEGTASQMVDDQCGPDSFEVDDDVIRDAVSRATTEILDEAVRNFLDDEALYTVLKSLIMPTAEYAIRHKVDEFLENYKLEGTFK